MTTILQLNHEELRAEIKDCLKEAINEIRELPVQPEPPQRMTIEDAILYFKANGIPVTKSKLYKDSMTGAIPVEKFGKRLVFIRKEIDEWLESQTISKSKTHGIAADQLSLAAKRKL